MLDQHVYAEAIENKGSEGTIETIHNRILDVHYQNSDGIVPVQEVAHRHFRKDLDSYKIHTPQRTYELRNTVNRTQ